MSPELISLSIIVVWGLFVIALERKFPYDPQRFFRRGFFTDFVMYTLFHSWWLGFLIAAVIRWVDNSSGLSRLQLVSSWPLWVQCLFFFVVHDFYIYWFHRWQHNNRFLWRVHEAHHSVKDVDWVAGSRSHAVEILINQTIEFAPIALLGAAPEVAIFKGTIDAVWGMWIHANVGVKSGWVQYVINGPEMHRWHHGLGNPKLNYATKLAIWDWIFGTAYNPDKKPKGYGFTHKSHYPEEPDFEPGTGWWKKLARLLIVYFDQHATMFRPFEKPIHAKQRAPKEAPPAASAGPTLPVAR